nr:MAG TPA: hypothetical protein [Caudoviricetes sp.]
MPHQSIIKLNIAFQRVAFLNGSFLLQVLGNTNHATTMPGISFFESFKIYFCNFKIYRAEKISKEIDSCIQNVYIMYTTCIRNVSKVYP